MKSRVGKGLAVVCTIALAAASCAGGAAAPPKDAPPARPQEPASAAPRSGPPVKPGSAAVVGPSAAEIALGGKLLKKLIDALGGEATVDGVRGFELVSHVERTVGEGKRQTDEVTTWIRFPDRYRQKLALPSIELVTIVSPEGSFLVMPQGSLPLPEPQRYDIERSVMRNLVALVKTRRNELFLVSGVLGEQLGGRAADCIVVRIGDEATTLWLDPETGRPQREEYQSLSSAGARLPKVTLDLSDFRRVDGLVYPFAMSATVDGVPAYSSRLERLVVNGPMDDSLFRPPKPPEPPSR